MQVLKESPGSEVDIASKVLVPIPHVDRGKGDTRNVMAIVISKSEKDYKLATNDGLIIGHFSRVTIILFWSRIYQV